MSEELFLALIAFAGVLVGALLPDAIRELRDRFHEHREMKRWRKHERKRAQQ
jgi:hypothetical protein